MSGRTRGKFDILSDYLHASAAKLGGQSELGAAALLKAVWWDLHLASLLTHLFFSHRVDIVALIKVRAVMLNCHIVYGTTVFVKCS